MTGIKQFETSVAQLQEKLRRSCAFPMPAAAKWTLYFSIQHMYIYDEVLCRINVSNALGFHQDLSSKY